MYGTKPIGSCPRAVHDLAAAEGEDLAGAGGLRFRALRVDRAWHVVDHQHDDVVGIDLAERGIVVRLAALEAEVLAGAGVELPMSR